MLNILDVHPPITGAKLPVRNAAEKLKQKAEFAASARQMRNRYISRVLPAATPPPPTAASIELFCQRVIPLLSRVGQVGDPQRTARGQVREFAERALQAGYDLGSVEVQQAMAEFLMLLVTEGFENCDTTGTVTGNSQSNFGGHYDGTRAAPIISRTNRH